MVAIKVVPHDGDLGEKVEIVRESLLSSAIQHPQIVSFFMLSTSVSASQNGSLCPAVSLPAQPYMSRETGGQPKYMYSRCHHPYDTHLELQPWCPVEGTMHTSCSVHAQQY